MSSTWRSTVVVTVDWQCECGEPLYTHGNGQVRCTECGRTWTVSQQLTMGYQEPPKPVEPTQSGPSLWEKMEATV